MIGRKVAVLLLFLSGTVAGCAGRGPDVDEIATDTAATATAAGAQAPPEAEDPPVERLAPEIRRACASVTEYWRGVPGAVTRRFDSTLTRPRSSALADACWVSLRLEEDPVRAPEFRVPYIAAGWLPIYEFDADGPDGRARVYQLDPVRCLVQERWDGGNPGDTTYVPAPWFEQHVACYRR
ncbi:MAG TPA: hypothetical protein VF862_11250 [Gemmatimonadales bacterium]